MTKTEIKSEVVVLDGRETLVIDGIRNGDTLGVEIPLPTDSGTISSACSVLMMNLAGCAETDLFVSAMTALGNHG